MRKKRIQSTTSWIPERPVSKGATAYHDAVIDASWHRENIKGLTNIIDEKIKDGDIIIDFGAGTGASAIYLLEYIKKNYKLMLVDNSASWLGKAYEKLYKNTQVSFFLLGKKENTYMPLDEVVGKNIADHVVSANTVHLIPKIEETFVGIYKTLKKKGTFTFQSGNIIQTIRKKGTLMIDDSINAVHDIAIDIIRNDNTYIPYQKDLEKRIDEQKQQRKFVFPNPRPIEYYVDTLIAVGFKNIIVNHKQIQVNHKDWLDFLRVRRLQAGILPEIGGKDATKQEEQTRDLLITKAAIELFQNLSKKNPLANENSFTADWTYVYAEK